MKRIWVNKEKCLGCKSCELACRVERDSLERSLFDSIKEKEIPEPRVHVIGDENGALAMQCRQCSEAACLNACPTGALVRDAETGKIYIESNKCCKCYMCVMTCPFGAIKPRKGSGRVMKCDACFGMDHPYCVEACPTKALIYGDEEDIQKMLDYKQYVAYEKL